MLSATNKPSMLSAIMLSVVAPFTYQKQNKYKTGQVYFMSKLACFGRNTSNAGWPEDWSKIRPTFWKSSQNKAVGPEDWLKIRPTFWKSSQNSDQIKNATLSLNLHKPTFDTLND